MRTDQVWSYLTPLLLAREWTGGTCSGKLEVPQRLQSSLAAVYETERLYAGRKDMRRQTVREMYGFLRSHTILLLFG
jgi:hypothetical protein